MTSASTNNFVASPSEHKGISGNTPAKFYLPVSRSSSSKVISDSIKLDDVVLERRTDSKGRTHFSYTVRWKKKKKQQNEKVKKEDQLSSDFFGMRLLDKLNDNFFQKKHETKKQQHSVKKINTSVSHSSKKDSDYQFAKYKNNLTTQTQLSPSVKYRRNYSNESSSETKSFESTSFSRCKSNKSSFTLKSRKLEKLPNPIVLKLNNSVTCINELLVEVILIDTVNGELRSFEIKDNLCGAMTLNKMIESFSNEYKSLKNFNLNHKLYVGGGMFQEGVSSRYTLIDQNLLNSNLQFIAGSSNTVRVYAIGKHIL